MEELEKNLTKANNNAHQKQLLIDGLNQSVDKLKRKVARAGLVLCVLVLIDPHDDISY